MARVRNLTVMFTDMKGFTARTANSSRSELMKLLREHDQLILPTLELRGGKLVKTIGDALMVSFPTAANAVLAAVEAQQALAQRNARVHREERIEIRIGIHSGEVTEVDGDLFGDTVNTASRVESKAKPGTIYFSDAVFEQLPRRLVPVVYLGGQRLKGIPKPVGIYTLRRAGFAGRIEAATAAVRRSLAVRLLARCGQGTFALSMLAVLVMAVALQNGWLMAMAALSMLAVLPLPFLPARLRLISVGAAFTLALAAGPQAQSSIQKRLNRVAASFHEQGSTAVSTSDRLGLYLLGLSSSAAQHVSKPSFKSSARLYLHIPGITRRVSESDHAMRSGTVVKALAGFARRVKRRDAQEPISMPEREVNLAGSHLTQAVPMQALRLTATAQPEGKNWRLYVTAEGEVEHTNTGRITIAVPGSKPLRIDGRLLVLLQDEGWLFPYRMRWKWSLSTDDPRLSKRPKHRTAKLGD